MNLQLEKERGRSQRDKLDRCRSTKLTIPPSSASRPLVYLYHVDRKALSAARLRGAGLLATADACSSRQLVV